MHDLRRQVLLESGKTTSRKARSRIASATSSRANSAVNSPAHSRANSRNPSTHNSDEEDASDGTAWSSNSVDDLLNGEDVDVPPEMWKAELHNRIEQIVDRKRSSTEGRAEALTAFSHILNARFAKDDVEDRTTELVTPILKSIRTETTEQEAVAAIKALNSIMITLDSDHLYDTVADTLRRAIENSESIKIKAEGINSLSMAAYFAGASDEEADEVMQFLLEISETDGLSVDAHDEPEVVAAALRAWGFMATVMEDLENETEAAMEAFVEQLDSSDTTVQIAAGENIALLYEKSYTPLEEDETVSEAELDSDDEDAPVRGEKMVRRYNVYHRKDQLLHTLDELANVSNRKISKKDRKQLHSSFADIRNSVEKPTRGPKYSTALDQETGRAYGAGRMKVKINGSVELPIDKWWKLQRLNALRRTLQGGFVHQYDENEAVSRCLPFTVSRK